MDDIGKRLQKELSEKLDEAEKKAETVQSRLETEARNDIEKIEKAADEFVAITERLEKSFKDCTDILLKYFIELEKECEKNIL